MVNQKTRQGIDVPKQIADQEKTCNSSLSFHFIQEKEQKWKVSNYFHFLFVIYSLNLRVFILLFLSIHIIFFQKTKNHLDCTNVTYFILLLQFIFFHVFLLLTGSKCTNIVCNYIDFITNKQINKHTGWWWTKIQKYFCKKKYIRIILKYCWNACVSKHYISLLAYIKILIHCSYVV